MVAHISNCPRKRVENENKRMKHLLEHVKTLAVLIMVSSIKEKLDYYIQLKEIEQELKTLSCYDGYIIAESILRGKQKYMKMKTGF